MAKPKLSSKTPDDPAINALIDFHAELIEHFNSKTNSDSHIAIVEIAVPEVKITEGGGRTATIQIRQLELMHGSDRDAADKLFTKVYSQRTGEKSRPAPEEPGTPLEGLEGLDDSV